MSEKIVAQESMPEEERPAVSEKPSRVVMIDLLKCVCIVMVILTHAAIPADVRKMILNPFTILPGVPIFLMISVYVRCLSADWNAESALACFEGKRFYRRFLRLFIPYLIAIAAIIAGLKFLLNASSLSLETIYRIFQQGGRGPGGYYVLILMQLLVLFPFMRYAFEKWPFASTLSMVLAQVLYETLCRYVWEMSAGPYDRLIFRYLTHLALGFLLYKYRDGIVKSAIPVVSMVIGAIYIINVYYLNYQQVLSIPNYATRGMIAVLFSFGLLALALRAEPWAKRHTILLSPFLLIGRASYHIMLWQMVYFYFARYQQFEESLGNSGAVIATDLAISLIGGVVWYLLSRLFRGIFKRK